MSKVNYIPINELLDNHAYVIEGRNAFAGVWLANEKSFVIARYKVGPNPYLHFEDHWDHSDPEIGSLGTAKPIRYIGNTPDSIRPCLTINSSQLNKEQEQQLLAYLQQLELDNPIEDGINTLEKRKSSAISFLKLLRRTN